MKSRPTRAFRKGLQRLPQQAQKQAEKAYALWQSDPYHNSLDFKQVHPSRPIYSARVGMEYRAVGIRREDGMVWFWIGSHNAYDKLLSQF
ncbi:hypothetical protein MJD09_00755 [bacterium]|nr:hypothetical protein [bacterium]